MKGSSTYQEILNEGVQLGIDRGRAEGLAEGHLDQARGTILRLGTRRFGPPDAATRQAVEAITDQDLLDELSERILDATGWGDLLAPRPARPNSAPGGN